MNGLAAELGDLVSCTQLSQTFQKWTPESVAREYYFFMIYQQVQQTAQAVSSLHALHHSWFAGGVNAQQFDATLGPAAQAAQDAVNQLKAKIDQAEKLPPTARGLPRREGL